MRKFILPVLFSIMAIFAVSCSNTYNSDYSAIQIKLPDVSARAAASDATLDFILTVKSDSSSDTITKSGKSGETITAEVKAGTYSVNLKAYDQTDTNHQTVLYEGSQNDVVVAAGKTTEISLKLKKISTEKEPEDEPEDQPETVKTGTIAYSAVYPSDTNNVLTVMLYDISALKNNAEAADEAQTTENSEETDTAEPECIKVMNFSENQILLTILSSIQDSPIENAVNTVVTAKDSLVNVSAQFEDLEPGDYSIIYFLNNYLIDTENPTESMLAKNFSDESTIFTVEAGKTTTAEAKDFSAFNPYGSSLVSVLDFSLNNDTGKESVKDDEQVIFSIPEAFGNVDELTITWKINGYTVEDQTGTSLKVSAALYPDYMDTGDNTICCEIAYKGVYNSKTINLNIKPDLLVYYNNDYKNYGANTNWFISEYNFSNSYPYKYFDSAESTGINSEDSATTGISNNLSATVLISYCFDPNDTFYGAIYDENNNIKIIELTLDNTTNTYKLSDTSLITFDSPKYYISRMAASDTNIYYTKVSEHNTLNAVDANIYYIASGVLNEKEGEIALTSDFTYVHSVEYSNGYLYVSGEQVNISETSGYDETAEYKIIKYPVLSDGTLDTGTEVLSYTDSDVSGISDLVSLKKKNAESTDSIEISVDNPITDFKLKYGNLYAIRFEYYNGQINSVDNTTVNSSLLILENNKTDFTAVKLPGSGTNSNGATVNLHPTKIVAVKPKELSFSDGESTSTKYCGTVSLNDPETLLTLNQYTYGYYFDEFFGGNSYYGNLHALIKEGD